MSTAAAVALALRESVEALPDPELPVLTLGQLGVIRGVEVDEAAGTARVDLTPTYSGCPAVEAMRQDIAAAVLAHGLEAEVRVVLTPAWSSDWISEPGRKALQDNDIAPPGPSRRGPVSLELGRRRVAAETPACPRCGSTSVERLAAFGASPCLSLWRCRGCREPFDGVKPL